MNHAPSIRPSGQEHTGACSCGWRASSPAPTEPAAWRAAWAHAKGKNAQVAAAAPAPREA